MMETRQRNNMPDRSRPKSTPTVHPTARNQDGGDKCATGAKTTTRLPKEGTTGTWTVRSLHAWGKIQQRTHELKYYQWDVLGLAEVRWAGFGEITRDVGHKIGTAETWNTCMVWHIHRTERSCGRCHQLHSHLQQTHLHPDSSETTQHQSFRSRHQPQTMMTRSNTFTSSLIAS